MRSLRWAMIVILVGSWVAAGGAPKEENAVCVGVNAELTGSKPTVGDSCKKAMELLAAQVNQAGGIQVGAKKYPLKLFVEDNEAKAESAAAAAQKLISQNNGLAIIGPNAQGNTIPSYRIREH